MPPSGMSGGPRSVNLAIFVLGTALAILAARPLSAPLVRRLATLGLFGLMVVAPIVSNSTSILFEALFGPRGLFPNFFGGGLPLNFPLAEDLKVFGLTLDADRYFFYGLGLFTALVGWGVTRWLSHSKFGYGLVAIRENEEAAEVMG